MSNEKQVKYACYSANISMAVVSSLSPLLFLTFRTEYGISYSLLGFLVLINFFSQLLIDLVFSFFSHKFNISKTIKTMPILTIIGLLVYSAWAFVFPNTAYIGLVAGTIIFSASAGLGEVLISPVIAALPSDEPDKEMSKLHSVYAWGVVGVVVASTLFLAAFGKERWQLLTLVLAVLPLISAVLFGGAKIPKIQTPEKASGAVRLLKNKGVWASFFAIFLGGATECTMAQWCSGYLEEAFEIPKAYGDIFGVALFSVMLGLGRTLYAKYGKNVFPVLILGFFGATVCYITAAVSSVPIIGLSACAFTGLCASMLWPGNLIVASDRFPQGGVFIYAIMAAGGDLGGSVAPQLLGIIADGVIAEPRFADIAANMAVSPEQLGMKIGILIGGLFPLVGVFLMIAIRNAKNKKTTEE